MGWGDMLVFMRYGEQFRTHRKLLQQFWSAQNITTARPTQRAETHKLLMKLLRSPADYEAHIEQYVMSNFFWLIIDLICTYMYRSLSAYFLLQFS